MTLAREENIDETACARLSENCGHQWRHIWLSGDIHGCLEQFAANYGIVVLIRGEIYLSQWGRYRSWAAKFTLPAVTGTTLVRAVRGNHEQMAMDALASRQCLYG